MRTLFVACAAVLFCGGCGASNAPPAASDPAVSKSAARLSHDEKPTISSNRYILTAIIDSAHPDTPATAKHTPEQIEAAKAFGFKSKLTACEIKFGTTSEDLGEHSSIFKSPRYGPRYGEKFVDFDERIAAPSSSVRDVLALFFEDLNAAGGFRDNFEGIMLHYDAIGIEQLGGVNALLKHLTDKFGQPDREQTAYKVWDFPTVNRCIAWNTNTGGLFDGDNGIYVVVIDTDLNAQAVSSEKAQRARTEKEKSNPGF